MRAKAGYARPLAPKLLTPAKANAKTAKGSDAYAAAILHLAPVDLAYPGRSVCPWASAGCRAACLNTSGRGQLRGDLTADNLSRSPIHRARIRRTRLFFDDREAFLSQLQSEIAALLRSAKRRRVRAVVRLNGTSDIPWERYGIPQAFPDVQFYDYTKSERRARAYTDGQLPANYHLTLSRSEETSDATVREAIESGVNVAVVFAGDTLPAVAYGAPVIDGLASDWRFTDPRGVVVGLLAKGRGKRDTTGFVVTLD